MRKIKRIVKIHKVEGFTVYCLFNNGESRIIDFERLFRKWKIDKNDLEWSIAHSKEAFGKVKLIDGTLTWKNIKVHGEDAEGNPVTYFYDLDPIVAYENSEPDQERQIQIGLLIRQARQELGLTQEELAKKSGTSRHYISRVENNRTGIELSTLIRIIEGGLGKKMKIEIQ